MLIKCFYLHFKFAFLPDSTFISLLSINDPPLPNWCAAVSSSSAILAINTEYTFTELYAWLSLAALHLPSRLQSLSLHWTPHNTVAEHRTEIIHLLIVISFHQKHPLSSWATTSVSVLNRENNPNSYVVAGQKYIYVCIRLKYH